MTYGNGSLRLRGDTWHLRWYWQGKRYERSAGTTNKSEAQRMLREELGRLDKGGPARPDQITYDELAEGLRRDYEVNRKSTASLKSRLDHLAKAFAGMRAVEITPQRVRDYVDAKLAETHTKGKIFAPASINRQLAALRRMFNLAINDKRLSHDHQPVVGGMMLEENNARQGFFEREELERLIAALPPKGPALHRCSREDLEPVFRTLYITGWRTSEVLSRQRRHLTPEYLRLEPGEGKDKKRGRAFPLTPELREIFRRQIERAERIGRERGIIIPWLFFRNDGRRMRGFRKAWDNACERAGLEDRLPHDFRRTAVRNMANAGVPTKTAMDAVGHRTLNMHQRYNIVSAEDMGNLADKLASYHEAELPASMGAKQGQIVPLNRGSEAKAR